ncbi:MAG: CaiB/BaiF CoA transferase family protein [Marinobacter sp.]
MVANIFSDKLPNIQKTRVLDLADINGLLAGHLLARIGADVIQVEPPRGHSARAQLSEETFSDSGALWQAYGVGKRSITADIKTDAGCKLILDLCKTADIFIESSQPGCMKELGLDYETISGLFPHLIYVSITPFGSSGPKADYQATDLILWAAGGALLPTASDGNPPVRMSIPQSFRHASTDAVTGALIALYERAHSGLGQHVDISAQLSVAQSTLSSVLAAAVGHPNYSLRPKPSARKTPKGRVPVGQTKWKARDGLIELHMGSGPATGRFTTNLIAWIAAEGYTVGALGELDWSQPLSYEDEGAYQLLEQAHQIVAEFIKTKTKVELIEAAIEKKLLLAPVNTIKDLLGSEHLNTREAFVQVALGKDSFSVPRYLFKSDAFTLGVPDNAASVGEHNDAIYLQELSMPRERLNDLMKIGVI